MKLLLILMLMIVANRSYAGCEDLDDKSMLRSVLAMQMATAQGFDMSKIFDVTQGCTIPNPKNLRCVFFTTDRVPNTECPEQFPSMESATIVCLMPDLSLAHINQAKTTCH